MELNDRLNVMLDELADDGTTKRVPYLGANWRRVDFERPITIGRIPPEKTHDGRPFVGVMVNNKWYCPERTLSIKEQENLMSVLLGALRLYENGLMEECKRSLHSVNELSTEWDTYDPRTVIEILMQWEQDKIPSERAIWWFPS